MKKRMENEPHPLFFLATSSRVENLLENINVADWNTNIGLTMSRYDCNKWFRIIYSIKSSLDSMIFATLNIDGFNTAQIWVIETVTILCNLKALNVSTMPSPNPNKHLLIFAWYYGIKFLLKRFDKPHFMMLQLQEIHPFLYRIQIIYHKKPIKTSNRENNLHNINKTKKESYRNIL